MPTTVSTGFPGTPATLLVSKSANVLAALPKSVRPRAEKALAGIWGAEDRDHALPLSAVQAFDSAYGAKFPKAVAKITEDAGELLAFYGYPARRWVHLRTQTRSNRPSPQCGTGQG